MKKLNLVVLDRISKEKVREAALSKELEELRRQFFSKVWDLIIPQRDGGISIFLPADEAWGQKTYEYNAVIFGETEPALFMYFLSNALNQQERRIGRAVYDTLSNKGDKVLDGASNGIGISAYAIDSSLFAANPWIAKFGAGQFLFDGGVYSLHHRKCNLDDDETEQIKRDMENYAICVLDIYE